MILRLGNIFQILDIRGSLGSHKGNILTYFAIILPIMIGISGLVIDVGRGVWIKTKLQRAADSGALTGAGYIADHQVAQQRADERVFANFGNPDVETYIPNGNEYTVELGTDIQTTFMKLLGYDTMHITADATAITNVVVGGLNGGGFPFCVINPNLNNDPGDDLVPGNYGRKYIIAYGEDNVMVGDWANGTAPVPAAQNGSGQGWRAALDLGQDGTFGGSGASDLVANIIYGWPGKMVIGDLVPSKTGNMTVVSNARNTMLGPNPLSWVNFNPHLNGDCSRVVLVPIVHLIHNTRRDTYTVADFNAGAPWDHSVVMVDGFAPFFILTINEQGDVDGDGKAGNKDRDWITGYFIPGVTINNYLPPDENTNNFGVYATPRLIE